MWRRTEKQSELNWTERRQRAIKQMKEAVKKLPGSAQFKQTLEFEEDSEATGGRLGSDVQKRKMLCIAVSVLF